MNLIQSFTFNSFQENMYIISDETHEAIIIDPGCSNAKEEYILQAYIEKNRLIVKGIYNTHCHIDHILGVNFAKNLFEVPFYAHAFEERNFSAEAKAVIQMWGMGKEAIGQSVFDVLPELLEQGFGEILLQVYTTGNAYNAYEMPIFLKRYGKKELLYFNFNYQAQRNIDGIIEGLTTGLRIMVRTQ